LGSARRMCMRVCGCVTAKMRTCVTPPPPRRRLMKCWAVTYNALFVGTYARPSIAGALRAALRCAVA
jgi:hypothetical protein